jgi:hypothetical protein
MASGLAALLVALDQASPEQTFQARHLPHEPAATLLRIPDPADDVVKHDPGGTFCPEIVEYRVPFLQDLDTGQIRCSTVGAHSDNAYCACRDIFLW